jgi:hypothetical protein
MLLAALPRDLSAKEAMNHELYRREPIMFKYDKLQKHVLGKCATAEALTLWDFEGRYMAPGVSS